jgi:hypothetical protein
VRSSPETETCRACSGVGKRAGKSWNDVPRISWEDLTLLFTPPNSANRLRFSSNGRTASGTPGDRLRQEDEPTAQASCVQWPLVPDGKLKTRYATSLLHATGYRQLSTGQRSCSRGTHRSDPIVRSGKKELVPIRAILLFRTEKENPGQSPGFLRFQQRGFYLTRRSFFTAVNDPAWSR